MITLTLRTARRRATADASPRERVLRGLDALPESDRLVLALELCEGLATTEIAAVLATTPRLVLRRRDHALTAMRRAVAGCAIPDRASIATALRSAM